MAIYRCLLDIAAGMDYLHSIGVLHGEDLLHSLSFHRDCPFTPLPPVSQANRTREGILKMMQASFVAMGHSWALTWTCAAGDLKGGNVLMKSTSMYDDPRGFVCKIGDFGLSRVLEHNSTHISTNTYGVQRTPHMSLASA